MPLRLEYFFDYVSPFSYLADSQIPAPLERTGTEIDYRPFFLGGVMKATGNSPPFAVPAKGVHSAVDGARWAARYGIPMGANEHFPVNTVMAMRVALVLQETGGFKAFHESIFPAMWRDGANIADPKVLSVLIEKAGANAAEVLERTQLPSTKEALRGNTEEAVERGAFGSPSFFVGDEMFFGNDRLDFVEQALTASATPA